MQKILSHRKPPRFVDRTVAPLFIVDRVTPPHIAFIIITIIIYLCSFNFNFDLIKITMTLLKRRNVGCVSFICVFNLFLTCF